jgi:hypothetical protein
MLTAIALALALQTQPPVTRHFVLHKGGHADVTLHSARLQSWSLTRGGVVSIGDIHSQHKRTTLRITASGPGATAITVGCDGGGREVWLVDVR